MAGKTVYGVINSTIKKADLDSINKLFNSLKSHATDKINCYPQNSWSPFNKISSYYAKLQLDFINKSATILSENANNFLERHVYYSARIVDDKIVDKSSHLKGVFIVGNSEFAFNLNCISDHKMDKKEYTLAMYDDTAYTNVFGHAEQRIKFTDSKEVYDASPSSYLGTYEEQCELVSKLNGLDFFARVDDNFLNGK